MLNRIHTSITPDNKHTKSVMCEVPNRNIISDQMSAVADKLQNIKFEQEYNKLVKLRKVWSSQNRGDHTNLHTDEIDWRADLSCILSNMQKICDDSVKGDNIL